MSSISISLTLTGLIHGRQQILGKNGDLVDCLIIPIDINNLIRLKDEKTIKLQLIAWPYKNKMPDRKDTHYIKQSFKKEELEKLSEEERNNLPFLGNALVWAEENQNTESKEFSSAQFAPPRPNAADDLPF
jgi:hypothetical protein